MKRLLTLIFLVTTLFCQAQNMKLTDPLGNEYVNGQTITVTITEDDFDPYLFEYVTEIIVHNLTDADLAVRTLCSIIELVDNTSAYICFGVCPPSLAWQHTLAGNGKETYSLHLTKAEEIGYGTCKFQLDYSANEQDMTLYLEIHVKPLGVKEQKKAVSLNAYPNPVISHSKVDFSYTLTDYSPSTQLVIRNLTGTKILSYPINPTVNTVSINTSNLVSGVYFYTIENNNQILIAKKLIVK